MASTVSRRGTEGRAHHRFAEDGVDAFDVGTLTDDKGLSKGLEGDESDEAVGLQVINCEGHASTIAAATDLARPLYRCSCFSFGPAIASTKKAGDPARPAAQRPRLG